MRPARHIRPMVTPTVLVVLHKSSVGTVLRLKDVMLNRGPRSSVLGNMERSKDN